MPFPFSALRLLVSVVRTCTLLCTGRNVAATVVVVGGRCSTTRADRVTVPPTWACACVSDKCVGRLCEKERYLCGACLPVIVPLRCLLTEKELSASSLWELGEGDMVSVADPVRGPQLHFTRTDNAQAGNAMSTQSNSEHSGDIEEMEEEVDSPPPGHGMSNVTL